MKVTETIRELVQEANRAAELALGMEDATREICEHSPTDQKGLANCRARFTAAKQTMAESANRTKKLARDLNNAEQDLDLALSIVAAVRGIKMDLSK